jgi:hypothetical protein
MLSSLFLSSSKNASNLSNDSSLNTTPTTFTATPRRSGREPLEPEAR